MTKKIHVDLGLCESNGVCMGVIPEVFDLDEEDYLHVLSDEVTRRTRPACATPCGSARARPSRSTKSDFALTRDHRFAETLDGFERVRQAVPGIVTCSQVTPSAASWSTPAR